MKQPGLPDAPPASDSGLAHVVARLVSLMRRLRGPGGCPWDREQTLASLKPFLVEECYEELDAVDEGDPRKICEELGDILLQIVFQSAICEEAGWFGFKDVAETLAEKLVRRHPHVFGSTSVSDAEEVLRNWESIKAAEGKNSDGEPAVRSAVDGIPRHLPALLKADRVQGRAARVGFDWNEVGPVWGKLDEELGELKEAIAASDAQAVQEELGDVLFTLVNLSRFLSVDAENALQQTTDKFMARFREVERRIRTQGRCVSDCGLDELDAVWDEVKAAQAEALAERRRAQEPKDG